MQPEDVQDLHVVSDVTQHRLTLMQEYNTLLAKGEEWTQLALQVAKEN